MARSMLIQDKLTTKIGEKVPPFIPRPLTSQALMSSDSALLAA